MKDEVIGSKKPKRVSKSPWEHKIRKRVKDAKRKANRPRMPKRR